MHLYKSVSDEAFISSAETTTPIIARLRASQDSRSKFVWPPLEAFFDPGGAASSSDNIKTDLSIIRRTADFEMGNRISCAEISSSQREPGGSRRIFISREDAKSRLILNWTEIAPILQDWGYEVLRLSDLSVADQIETFASAAYVVGVHGAGLTNLVFAPIGVHVLEIFPALRATGAFWKLSSGLGHDYHALIADDPELPRPDYATYRSAPGQKSPNVILSPEKLRKALEDLHSADNGR